ncbi:MAG: hypothetical protein V3V33_07635 [Candidatus Lokiarchaeia archaeon]
MVKPCFGAIIGGFLGLVIGWIIYTFVMDQAAIEEFQRITNTSVILIAGSIGLVSGFIITYVTKK